MIERPVVIAPEGKLKETLKLLLDLANRPQDVAYPGNGSEILVPEYLAEAYMKATDPAPPPRKRASKKEEKED